MSVHAVCNFALIVIALFVCLQIILYVVDMYINTSYSCMCVCHINDHIYLVYIYVGLYINT